MLVVLVIVVRPHTGTLRGLRRRPFLSFSNDPRSGADRGRNTRARNTYDSDHHTGVRGPLDPQNFFACGGHYLLKNTSVSCTLWEPDPMLRAPRGHDGGQDPYVRGGGNCCRACGFNNIYATGRATAVPISVTVSVTEPALGNLHRTVHSVACDKNAGTAPNRSTV